MGHLCRSKHADDMVGPALGGRSSWDKEAARAGGALDRKVASKV